MSYQDAQALATQYINDEIPDLLSEKNYFFNVLQQRKKKVSGGNFIQMPLMFQDSDQTGFINGNSDLINLNPNQAFIYGQLNWKYFYYANTVTLQDMVTTVDTDLAVLDLIKGKAAQSINTAVRNLSQSIYGSGISDTNRFNGMADIFGPSGQAYAGLNNTTYPDWFYLADTAINGGTPIYTPNYTNVSKMITTLQTRMGQSPMDPVINDSYNVDLLISNAAVWNTYMASVPQVSQRFQDEDTAKTGFKFVEVNGVKWMFDAYSPGTADGTTQDNYLYVLSMNSFHLFYKYWFNEASGLDYKNMTIPNQPMQSSVNYLSGNLGCTNRRINGVFKTLVA